MEGCGQSSMRQRDRWIQGLTLIFNDSKESNRTFIFYFFPHVSSTFHEYGNRRTRLPFFVSYSTVALIGFESLRCSQKSYRLGQKKPLGTSIWLCGCISWWKREGQVLRQGCMMMYLNLCGSEGKGNCVFQTVYIRVYQQIVILILRVQISRWDYHATHVNQLFVLAAITDSAQFKETADRSVGAIPLL